MCDLAPVTEGFLKNMNSLPIFKNGFHVRSVFVTFLERSENMTHWPTFSPGTNHLELRSCYTVHMGHSGPASHSPHTSGPHKHSRLDPNLDSLGLLQFKVSYQKTHYVLPQLILITFSKKKKSSLRQNLMLSSASVYG